jgi:hypothetical protein
MKRNPGSLGWALFEIFAVLFAVVFCLFGGPLLPRSTRRRWWDKSHL